MRVRVLASVALLVGLAGCSDPDDVPSTHISVPPEPIALTPPPEVERFPQKTALFGDLHVHTSWSSDAYSGGNRLGPNTAYRFAKGEKVELQNGAEAQLHVPLDFVALTDHAENFAGHLACTMPGQPEFEREQCRALRAGDFDQEAMLSQAFELAGVRPMPRGRGACPDEGRCEQLERSTWQRVQDAANAHNEPGRFTALIGYEFSSLLTSFGMLHRNVIFRGSDVVPQAISAVDVTDQKDFFRQLDSACEAPCEVLTIPHNTNYSWGMTFSRTAEDGSTYSDIDLERRARIERVFEVTQQKGTSECQISVGAADEDCDYGILFPACRDDDELRCIRESSLYRNVLLDGLTLGRERDFNPYKLGVIGSTDTHLSDPGNAAPGIPPMFEPAEGLGFAVNRLLETEHIVMGPIRKLSPGGLAGVWAEANTRADIFDALRRREVFATSGPRIRIRFFAGDLPADIVDRDDSVALAYARGVPMGGDLDGTSSPRFWVWASQDPADAPIDRIQIIKGWSQDGEEHQRVWDAVCSGGREAGDDGRCPPTAASVDLTTCARTGRPGASELQTSFVDPGFVEDQSAFYYARVLTDPRCRWTSLLALSGGLDLPDDLPDDLPALVQERAWSSPIFSASP